MKPAAARPKALRTRGERTAWAFVPLFYLLSSVAALAGWSLFAPMVEVRLFSKVLAPFPELLTRATLVLLPFLIFVGLRQDRPWSFPSAIGYQSFFIANAFLGLARIVREEFPWGPILQVRLSSEAIGGLEQAYPDPLKKTLVYLGTIAVGTALTILVILGWRRRC